MLTESAKPKCKMLRPTRLSQEAMWGLPSSARDPDHAQLMRGNHAMLFVFLTGVRRKVTESMPAIHHPCLEKQLVCVCSTYTGMKAWWIPLHIHGDILRLHSTLHDRSSFTQKEMAYVLHAASQIRVGDHDSHPAISELVINHQDPATPKIHVVQ